MKNETVRLILEHKLIVIMRGLGKAAGAVSR